MNERTEEMLKKAIRARATLTTIPVLGGMALADPNVLAAFETIAIALIAVVVDWIGGE